MGDGVQVSSSGISIGTDGVVVASDGDSCCCGGSLACISVFFLPPYHDATPMGAVGTGTPDEGEDGDFIKINGRTCARLLVWSARTIGSGVFSGSGTPDYCLMTNFLGSSPGTLMFEDGFKGSGIFLSSPPYWYESCGFGGWADASLPPHIPTLASMYATLSADPGWPGDGGPHDIVALVQSFGHKTFVDGSPYAESDGRYKIRQLSLTS